MKCQKMKKFLYRGLSVFMGLYLSLSSFIGSYASDSTSSGNDTWTMNAGTFLELAWSGFAKEISAPYVIWNSLSGCTYDGFRLWMQNGDHYSLLEDGNVVGHGGAGYSRPSDKINNSTEIDVEPELTQYVLNYVQYCTTQTSLGYTECYIHSYNFLSPDLFPNYQMYASCKEYIHQQDGYSLLYPYRANGTFQYIIATIYDRNDLNFVGTTTQGGFTNVHGYIGWSELTGSNFLNASDECVKVATNGTITDLTSLPSISSYQLYNLAMGATANNGTYNKFYVFSNYEKNELVYVFSTLNALKNYNAGMPQPYYLTTSGQNTGTWTATGGGIINTGAMNNSGNYYSSVTSGIGANWTPDQILALVDKVSSGNGGSGGSGGSSSDNSGLWSRIGDAIGNLIDGIINVLTTVIEHLSDALLSVIHLLTGYTDDNGVVHEGLFGKLLNLVNSGFNNFLASIFSWLPEEIVTLFTAVLVFGIFFGLLKMLRR